jgi:hypothetical protein
MTDPHAALHAYVDGELEGAELDAFEAHLARCEACADELPRLLAMLTALDAVRAAPRLAVLDGGAAAAAGAAHPRGDREAARDAPAAHPRGDREAARAAHPRGDREAARDDRAAHPRGDREAARDDRAAHPRGDREAARDDRAAHPRGDRRAPRRRAIWIAAGVALAAAAAVIVWLARPAPAPEVASLGELAPHRTLEARLSYTGADGYRPRDVARGEQRHERIAFARLDQLERAGDHHGLGVAALLNGELSTAAQELERAGASSEIDSDRAALALADGSAEAIERALDHADHALAADPRSGAARWNRALALAALNLQLAAALDFDQVAALHEPGWADEARARATALRAEVAQRRTRWQQTTEAKGPLIADGTVVQPRLGAVTGTMTLLLYDAVRSAPSRARVEALLPLAQALDAAQRSDRLVPYVRRIAASDFRVRAPLADIYRQMVLKQPIPDAVARGFAARLERAGADDIRMGVMVRRGEVASNLETYRRLAAASGDPWFAVIAEHEAGKAERARGNLAAGERRLRDALDLARRERVGYRALLVQIDLVLLDLEQGRLARAHTEAQVAYREATLAGEVLLEMNLLGHLASINQDRYAPGLARAYLAELLERSQTTAATGPSPFDDAHDCSTRVYAYESLANVSLWTLAPDRARSELARVPTCPDGAAIQHDLTTLGALVQVQLYQMTRRDDDGKRVRDQLAALRAIPDLTAGQRAVLAYLEGALLLQRDRVNGERAVRDAIRSGDAPDVPQDVRIKIRAYGLSLLALDAGRAADFARVLEVLAETLGVARPERCALAVAIQDQQATVAFVDARGELGGQYTARRVTPAIDPTALVPAAIVARLRACPRVDVLTRAPVLGLGRLLPPDLAWSYLLKGGRVTPHAGTRLVVANPVVPAELKLPPLAPYPEEPGDVQVLRGADATPARVTQALTSASVIEFHTHGIIGNDVSEASYLALSPEADGQYALTASDLTRVALTASPLVLLGACHAAASSRSLEGGTGLAEAFLRSGARAVVASPDAVPDLAAHAFFAAVRDRVERGADPAAAVRDERVRRLGVSRDEPWVAGIVVFQ